MKLVVKTCLVMVSCAILSTPVLATNYALPSETSAMSSRLNTSSHTPKALDSHTSSSMENIRVAAYSPTPSPGQFSDLFTYSKQAAIFTKPNISDNHILVIGLAFAPLLFLFLSIYKGLKRADERMFTE